MSTKWTHHYSGESIIGEICYDSVEGYCEFEKDGCIRLHSTLHFHWQVRKENGQCVNLRPEQVLALEKAYCDPRQDEIELPQVEPATWNKPLNCLLKVLQGRQTWNANFDKMILTLNGSNDYLIIRRLQTEKVTDSYAYDGPLKSQIHWQVRSADGHWLNLGGEQDGALEEGFKIMKVKVLLPPLVPSTMNQSLKCVLQLYKEWEADLEILKLTDKGNIKVLDIRRKCPEMAGIRVPVIPDPCLYSWYFIDKRNRWIEYGSLDSTLDPTLKCSVNSEEIEEHYELIRHSLMFVASKKHSYSLDLVNMVQTDLKKYVQRRIKRRPKPHIQDYSEETNNGDEYLLLWNVMPTRERVKRVKLNPSTDEYQKISIFYDSQWQNNNIQVKPQVLQIERVQNLYLWKALQNKMQEMEAIYDDKNSINIQLLFHGTKSALVDKICLENFDLRLDGNDHGEILGKGAYFYTFSNDSYKFCDEVKTPNPVPANNDIVAIPNSNTSSALTENEKACVKYMFVAEVAVGKTTHGNNSITRPPLNSSTYTLFDSTVDEVPNYSIVVKYDKQEYYPKYILTLS